MNHDPATTAYRLGDLLMARGLLSAAELDEAVRIQQTTRQRLGEVLTQHNLVSAEQLQRCLRRQTLLRQAVVAGALAMTPFTAAQAESRAAEERPRHRIEAPAPPAGERDARDDGWRWALAQRPYSIDPRPLSYRSTALPPREDAGILELNLGESSASTRFNPLRGEFKGGVASYERGLRYKVKLSRDQVRFAASFQF
jgi:hypothetical protein